MSSSAPFLERLAASPAVAILRWPDEVVARAAMDAAVAGGVTNLEFTLTTGGAFDLIREFARQPGLTVGAGTVLTAEEAERAVDAGARFLVSPVVDAPVIEAAHRLETPILPGTFTPTEMLEAHRLGAACQKLFPLPGTGASYLRACLGPMPFLRVVPTSGIDLDNADEWFEAGAFAVGFVASLFTPEALATRDYAAIEATARRIRDLAERRRH